MKTAFLIASIVIAFLLGLTVGEAIHKSPEPKPCPSTVKYHFPGDRIITLPSRCQVNCDEKMHFELEVTP